VRTVIRAAAEAPPIIRVRGLRKSYGAVEAVGGIDLEVAAGEVFAFLGPNGAGKTTTVEILEGHRAPDAGEVSVLGRDPMRPTREWQARIGVVPQTSQMQAELTVREWLELFAGYYPAPRPIDETIDMVGLGRERHRRASRLSGGQQRRLDLALALIGGPELLFLDEPTTGFDPAARRGAWDTIAGLRALGTTVFLTTHYMEEAEALADRVAIIRGGRIVAEGAPRELSRARGGTRISVRLPDGLGTADLPRGLPGTIEARAGRIELRTDAPVRALNALTGWALERGIELPELEARGARLEDVFLELTTGEAEGAGASENGSSAGPAEGASGR
jgi:ABC-2 type transport system ATP-binding protein